MSHHGTLRRAVADGRFRRKAKVRLVRLAEVYLLFLLRRTLLAKGGHSSFSSDNIHGDNTDGRKHSTDDDSRRNWHHKRRNMRADAFCG